VELNSISAGTLDAEDLFNCVLLTSITAVAVVRRCNNGGAAAVDFVMVPFVASAGEEATLYAATMHKDWRAPVIRELLTAQLHRLPERVNLIAHLAVLLLEPRRVSRGGIEELAPIHPYTERAT
jgi:hypothetical protein